MGDQIGLSLMPKILNLTLLLDITPHQKHGVLSLSFMLHLIFPLIVDHMLEKSICNSF